MIVILQARLTSRRFPAKSLLSLAGKPVIRWCIDTLGRTPLPRVIAIPSTPENDPLADYCEDLIPICRGSEDNVLSRYHLAAHIAGAKSIVRITGDCPLLTSEVIIACAAEYQQNPNSYVYSAYGDGFDCEVFPYLALDVAYHAQKWLTSEEIEHVTPFIKEWCLNEGGIRSIGSPTSLKLSIDTFEDYLFISRVAKRLKERHYCVSEIQEIAQDEANRKPVGE